VLFLVYDKDKKLMGGKYFLGYNKNIWYMYGGTSNEGRRNKAGYNLVWESFLGLKRSGYDFLDFEGVDDDRFAFTQQWGGFSHFKEKFGGVKVEFPLPRIKYFSSILKHLSKFTHFNI
jgi:lipid II:glycine glycyltransferase (peptidoglycan interpeptide bridge formation enzyme)